MRDLIELMANCEQFPGQSVYEHGLSVKRHFDDLIGEQTLDWKLPNWFLINKNNILNNLHEYSIISDYLIFHDCGKFYCRTIDENNKIHFPNHAEVSKETYLKASGNVLAASLI